jgi:para-aminobenzoate synthetase component 1
VNAVELHPLPYHCDGRHWFSRVRPLGRAVWLDSAQPHSRRGRFDIISASPLAVVDDGVDDPIAATRVALAATFDPNITADTPRDLPFAGGAIGLFGYELGRRLEQLPLAPAHSPDFPSAQVGLYSWGIITDHLQQRSWLLIRPETPRALREQLLNLAVAATPAPTRFTLTQPWRSDFDRDAYRRAFARLQSYIRDGDCYQVNLARRFHAGFEGDPFSAYLMLRETAAAPFSAYLDSPAGAVLCLSPERFIAADKRAIFTQPIKGTAARSPNPRQDAANADSLLASEKNRAENLMIVDLLRNDLGRSCEPGSIRVERLFELQSFATVHHLVSSIRGTLRADMHPLAALRNCFPGGSVTGAPKHRAMQIIDELEPRPRSVFCGAIGYMSLCGKMDTNITIRTLLAQRGHLYAWAGGGIVADSDCDEEFEETRSKIEPLLRALETDTAT